MHNFKKIKISILVLASLMLFACSIYEDPQVLTSKEAENYLKNLTYSLESIYGSMDQGDAFRALDELYHYLEIPLIIPKEPARKEPDSMEARFYQCHFNKTLASYPPYMKSIHSIPTTIFKLIGSRPNHPSDMVSLVSIGTEQKHQPTLLYFNDCCIKNYSATIGTLNFSDSLGFAFTGRFTLDSTRLRWNADTTYMGGIEFLYPASPSDTSNTVLLSITNYAAETYRNNTNVRSVRIRMEVNKEDVLLFNYSSTFIRGFPQSMSFVVSVGEWDIERRLSYTWEHPGVYIQNRLRLQNDSQGRMGANLESIYTGNSEVNPYASFDHDYRMVSLDGYIHLDNVKVECRLNVAALDSTLKSSGSKGDFATAANRNLNLKLLSYPKGDWLARIQWNGPSDNPSNLTPYLIFSDSTSASAIQSMPLEMLPDFYFSL